MEKTYPYSDQFMIWDDVTKRYYITEAALMAQGINLRARLGYNITVDATAVINGFTQRVSEVIYNFIHKHSNANRLQDEIIEKNRYARDIIYRALVNQAFYMVKNGDLSLSVDAGIRALAIDENARHALNTELDDLRISILYAGGGGYYGYT